MPRAVTGSLVFSEQFVCLDVYCAAGFASCRIFCSTDCVLLAGFGLSFRRVSECWTMATDGAALVENRAGITSCTFHGMPWKLCSKSVPFPSAMCYVKLLRGPLSNKTAT